MAAREKVIVFTLLSIQFTFVLDFTILLPLGPKLIEVFNLEPVEFSYIIASYTFTAGLFGFLGALVVDRYDRKWALLFCYLGFIAGNMSCALSTNYESLLFARTITGIFAGVLSSLVLSFISDVIPYENRASAIGKVMLAFSFSSLIGVPVGMYLANHFMWQAPFVMLSILSIIFCLVAIRNLPSITTHIDLSPSFGDELRRAKEIIADVNNLRGLAMMFLLVIGQFSVVSFLSTFLVVNNWIEFTDVKYIYLLAGMAFLITLPVFGTLSDKYGKLRIFTIFIFISLIPLYLLSHLGMLPILHISGILTITTLLFITIGGRMIPATAMISASPLPKHRGSFMSLHAAMQQFATGAAVFMSGSVLIENEKTGTLLNYYMVGWIAIIASLACLFLARGLKARS